MTLYACIPNKPKEKYIYILLKDILKWYKHHQNLCIQARTSALIPFLKALPAAFIQVYNYRYITQAICGTFLNTNNNGYTLLTRIYMQYIHIYVHDEPARGHRIVLKRTSKILGVAVTLYSTYDLQCRTQTPTGTFTS